LLGDPQTAGYYLNELKTIKPDYSINFDSAQKELEDMLAEQQAASQSTTELPKKRTQQLKHNLQQRLSENDQIPPQPLRGNYYLLH